MLAILCPGQGAQSPGFLRPWLDLPSVREELGRLSTRAYVDLARLGSDPDADVVDTAIAQPLVVGAAVAVGRLLGPLGNGCVVVGHSVGELSALALARMVDPAVAVDLARIRGRAMAAAAASTQSGMTVLLGGDDGAIESAVAAAGCWVANRNGAGQVVAAGPAGALESLAAAPPAGARLRPLSVAGAFHTPLMASAQAVVRTAVEQTPTNNGSSLPVVSNRDGRVVTSPGDYLADIAAQVTQPVRFDLCVETLRRIGVTAAIEVAPGGVLTGILRRELPGVDAVALRTPEDLGAAHDLLDRYDIGETWPEPWRVLVAPASGTLVLPTGDDDVASVRNRAGVVPLPAAPRQQLVEWLASDGDPVSEGQPLARVSPVAP